MTAALVQTLLAVSVLSAPPPASVRVTEHVLVSRHTPRVRQHVVVVAPADAPAASAASAASAESIPRYPGLVALAGLGEARRGNKAGAWGWVQMYGLLPAIEALMRGVLTVKDAQGLITGDRLAAWNAELAGTPYRGLVIVCPFPSNDRASHRFIVEELIPWAERELPVQAGRWAIDGISLGGGISSVVGFENPDVFSSIGSLQGAVTQGRRPAVERAIARWATDRAGGWSTRSIQVITSRGDGFRPALTDFHNWLDKRRIEHHFEVLPGRHDKAFVRGPGVLRMLMFHDKALWAPNAPAKPGERK